MNKIKENQYLKIYRKTNKISQKAMAELLSISQVQYSNIENGKTPINIEYAKIFNIKYGLDINILIGLEEFNPKNEKKKSKPIFRKTYDQVNNEVKFRFIEQINKYGEITGYNKPLKLAMHLKINVEFIHQLYTTSKTITLFKIYRLSNLIPSINLDYTFRNTGPLLINKKNRLKT